jgi:hypothetical protein
MNIKSSETEIIKALKIVHDIAYDVATRNGITLEESAVDLPNLMFFLQKMLQINEDKSNFLFNELIAQKYIYSNMLIKNPIYITEKGIEYIKDKPIIQSTTSINHNTNNFNATITSTNFEANGQKYESNFNIDINLILTSIEDQIDKLETEEEKKECKSVLEKIKHNPIFQGILSSTLFELLKNSI